MGLLLCHLLTRISRRDRGGLVFKKADETRFVERFEVRPDYSEAGSSCDVGCVVTKTARDGVPPQPTSGHA
jgi:hypothetical protein